VIKSARYLGQLKRINSVQKMASPGERVISSLFPNRTYVNNWSGNLYEQVAHYKQWTYVAVHTICSRLAGLMPNFVYSYDESVPGVTRKGYQHGYYNLQKSLSAIKPHEDLEPLENEHPLRRLFESPNPVDTSFDYLYETQMFQELTGVSYTWAVPNSQGVPCELWCIPSHWVWPRTGGDREVSPAHPHAGELIEYYEVRPWGGTSGASFIRFPPNEVIMERWKSPIDKINGYAKLTAGAQWVDTEESITRSRWSQFINQAMPGLHLELGSGYEDPDDNEIARIEAKFMARFQGEANFGRPIITPPGAKVTALGFSPTEMSYKDSEQEIRDMILSLFQVPKAAVGISEGMTFGSVMATLASMCSQCINPRLTMRGQALTKHLASRWSKPGRRVKLFWEDCVPSDPAQVNSDIQSDLQCILPGQELQGRVIGGSKARYTGEAVEIVTGSGTVLVVTPNHPVATPSGFVPAGSLKKGQNLLRYVKNGYCPSDDDVQYAPTLVEDVFDTLSSTFPSSLGEMPASPVDFHGDGKGFNGYVQVVGTYGKLRDTWEPKTSQHLHDGEFVGFGLVKANLSGFSHLAQGGFWHGSSLIGDGKLGSTGFGRTLASQGLGDLGGPNSTLALRTETRPPLLSDRFSTGAGQDSGFNVRPVHGQTGGFGCTAHFDAVPTKSLPQPHMPDTFIVSNLLDGLSGTVDAGNPVHVEFGFGNEFLSFGSASELDAPLFEFDNNGRSGHTKFSGKGSDGFPGEVTTDQVVNVRKFHYDGLVYDFESPLGFIVVNGVCVSNCHAITPNEVRALRGRASYKHGGDDPIVMGPGGPMPFPINTGEDIEDLAELIKPFAQPEQAEQQAEEGGMLELPEQPTTEGASELPEAPEIEEVESIVPEEPNGKPSKGLVTKETHYLFKPRTNRMARFGKYDGKKATLLHEMSDGKKLILLEGGQRLSAYPNELITLAKPIQGSSGNIQWNNDGSLRQSGDFGKALQDAKSVKAKGIIPGGLSEGLDPKDFSQEQLDAGIKVEMEHTSSRKIAEEIAMDHLTEDPDYYIKLRRMESKSKSVKKVAEGFTPVASGLAVMAYDTGRVLMLQRHIDDNRGGTWEFPGGKIEGDTDPLESAKREWYEETGIELPTGKLVDNWQGTNGKYQGFVYLVPKEDDVDIVNRRLDTNPDGDVFEVVAWVSPKDFDNHNLRPELLADLTHLQRATTLGKSLKYLCKHIPNGRGRAVVKSIVVVEKSIPVEVAKKKEEPKKRAKRKAKGVKK